MQKITSFNIAAGRIVAGGKALLSAPVTFICLTPSSLANSSTSFALESHLLTPLLSKLSKARSAGAEASGIERVIGVIEEEERGKTELSKVRKKVEWKSSRSELTQILAPGNLINHGGTGNHLGTSLNNYSGRVAALRAIAKGVKGLLQYSQVLSRGVQCLRWITHS